MTTLVCKRDPVFDIVRAFLMYFVICGHLIATGIISPPDSPPPSWIGSMVVGASMPCFFAISGLFSAKNFEMRNWPKIAARTIGFLWPIASFGVLFGVMTMIYCRDIKVLVSTVWHFFNNLWFLRTLVFINLISAGVFLLSNTIHGRLVLFFIIYAMLIFLSQSVVPLSRWWKSVMHMLPYFVFGLFFLRRCIQHSAIWFAIVSSAFFISISLLEGPIQTNGMGFYWVDHSLTSMFLTKRGLVCFFGRTAMGVTGTIFLLWVFRWLLNKAGWLSYLSHLGTTTLGVYTIHQWILARVGTHFHPPFPFPNGWKWLIAGIVFLICHSIILLICRNRFTKEYFFGNESMLHRVLEQIFVFRNNVSSSTQ